MEEWHYLTLGLLVKQSFLSLKDSWIASVFNLLSRKKFGWPRRIWFEWFSNIKTSKSSKECIRYGSQKKYRWWSNSKECIAWPYLLCSLTYGMIICRKFIYLVYCVLMMQLLTPSKIAIFISICKWGMINNEDNVEGIILGR